MIHLVCYGLYIRHTNLYNNLTLHEFLGMPTSLVTTRRMVISLRVLLLKKTSFVALDSNKADIPVMKRSNLNVRRGFDNHIVCFFFQNPLGNPWFFEISASIKSFVLVLVPKSFLLRRFGLKM